MATTEPRRIVIADPINSPGAPARFVVAGQSAQIGSGDVKMYEWDGEAEKMSMVGLQTDAGQIKAVAWSSLPTHRHLIALGQSNGRTQIISLAPSTLSLSISPNSVLNNNLLTVKPTRPVTSLAFSTLDPNLLAVGLDRHRSDCSLLIWDISDIASHIPSDGERTWTRPLDRLEVTNPLARDGVRPADGLRHIQQYCPGESVNSVAWIPGSSHELLASSNNKVIRLFDLRSPGPSAVASAPRELTAVAPAGATAQWSTRAVYSLTPDPNQPQRFASFETTPGGGMVRLWDTRRPGLELLNLDVCDGGIVTLEWMQGSSGVLGVGTKEGGVTVWDIVSGPKSPGDGVEEWTSLGGMRQIVKPKQNLHSFAFAPPVSKARGDVVFVVRDGTIGAGPVGSAPTLASSSRGELAIVTSSLRLVDPDLPVRTRPASPVNRPPRETREREIDEAWRKNRFQLAPDRVSALLAAETVRSRSASPGSAMLRGVRGRDLALSSEEEKDELTFGEDGDIGGIEGMRKILKHDIGYTMRRRAEEGYSLTNLLLNAAIATRYPGAERIAGIWEFVDHFVQATTPSISSQGSYDLTYQGIWPIWTGQLSSTPVTRDGSPAQQPSAAWTALRSHPSVRHSPNPESGASTPRHREVEIHNAEYNTALAQINAMRTEAGHIGAPGHHHLPHTEKAPQRRMILAVCGENHAYETMTEVNRLVDDDQRTKAACWAFFAGEEGPAVTILMRSDDEKHRLMGATIAGFMTQSRAERGSLFWQEHWRSMVDKVDDPYIRAVLARIAGDDWDGILYDENLPLLDRVAVAVCNLSDKDLTSFLRNRLKRCLDLGSLPGLALTGFTSAGMTLVQRWLDRTGDLQTVALLSAYFPRSRLSRSEVRTLDNWQDGYRDLLDGWRAWVERCALDVAWLEERRALGDDDTNGPVQTVVVCPVCNNVLTKQKEEHLLRKNILRGAIRVPTARTITCTYCQNALPRCSICLLHVRPEVDVNIDGWKDEQADTIDSAYVSCQTCRHGGHAAHILGWFEGGLDGEPAHDACPVSGCQCRCSSL